MHIAQLVKDYVDSHIYEKITLTDIKNHLYYSTVTVSEHFKKEFGKTVMVYVNEMKIEEAKGMLLDPEMKIREISEALGFSNTESFSRSFKKHAGLSPTEWRHAIAAKDTASKNE